MFLLDTVVVSESIKPRPDASVQRWMRFHSPAESFISVLTLGELYFGVAQLNSAARERELKNWILDVEKRFSSRIVVFDDLAARQWGYLRAAYPKAPTTDAQLAATALAHDFTFVTRNVRHFPFDGLKVVNPWEA
ncbi:MAG TPA: type II toxin-antitoxin system VapC family toxin [Rhizomicrobium sp.]